jgi:hypothetical protein
MYVYIARGKVYMTSIGWTGGGKLVGRTKVVLVLE